MVTSVKDRRHSGRVSPICYGAKKEILIEEGIEPLDFWDDWQDYRDGFRGCKDRKMIRSEHAHFADYLNVKKWNKKLRLLMLRRKARKAKSL